MYIYTYIRIHIYICTQTHTHTRTVSLSFSPPVSHHPAFLSLSPSQPHEYTRVDRQLARFGLGWVLGEKDANLLVFIFNFRSEHSEVLILLAVPSL